MLNTFNSNSETRLTSFIINRISLIKIYSRAVSSTSVVGLADIGFSNSLIILVLLMPAGRAYELKTYGKRTKIYDWVRGGSNGLNEKFWKLDYLNCLLIYLSLQAQKYLALLWFCSPCPMSTWLKFLTLQSRLPWLFCIIQQPLASIFRRMLVCDFF